MLPGYNRRLEDTHGCPTQYNYGTNHRQKAEYRTKTVIWDEARAAEIRRSAAEARGCAAAARNSGRFGIGCCCWRVHT